MQAIVASKLAVCGLDILTTVHSCSLALDQVMAMLQLVQRCQRLKDHMRSLSLSLSHSLESIASPSGCSTEFSVQRVGALASFLRLFTTGLETLHLHWYNLINKSTPARDIERRFFNSVADSVSFTSLRRCTLQGIWTNQNSLLNFLLQTTQLQSLELDIMHLEDHGTFHKIIQHMTTCLLSLQYLRLYDLSEPYLISFHLPDGLASVELIRQGSDAHLPIEYWPNPKTDFIDTPASRARARKHTLEFGPPSGKPFIS